MSSYKNIYVIITAGGLGTRMGGKIAKQFLTLEGKPILLRTIEMFIDNYKDINIILTLPQEYKEYWRNYCFKNNLWFKHILADGGFTRFHSVKNALSHVPDNAIVAVHDGVRPFVPKEILDKLLEYDFKGNNVSGVIPVMPAIESMRVNVYKKDGSLEGTKTVNRDDYMFVQTPQVFDSTILKKCYNQGFSPSFTDDASVVESCGYKVATSAGSKFNIKLTTTEDLLMAKIILDKLSEEED
jgi:4-diphosphocytidyl-2-methyl-D-erithritol synthase